MFLTHLNISYGGTCIIVNNYADWESEAAAAAAEKSFFFFFYTIAVNEIAQKPPSQIDLVWFFYAL